MSTTDDLEALRKAALASLQKTSAASAGPSRSRVKSQAEEGPPADREDGEVSDTGIIPHPKEYSDDAPYYPLPFPRQEKRRGKKYKNLARQQQQQSTGTTYGMPHSPVYQQQPHVSAQSGYPLMPSFQYTQQQQQQPMNMRYPPPSQPSYMMMPPPPLQQQPQHPLLAPHPALQTLAQYPEFHSLLNLSFTPIDTQFPMLLSNPPLWQLIRPQIIFLLDSGFAPELIASYGFDIAIVLACGQALASAGTTLSPMEQEASQRLRGQPMVPLTQNVPQPFTQQTAAPAAAPSSRRNLPPSPLRMRIEELATSDDETHASRQRAQPIPPVIEEPRTEEQSAPEEDSLLVEAIEEDELETSDGDEINELMMATDEQKVSGQELRIGDAEDDASGAFEFVSAIAAQEEDVTASSMLPSADSILEETGLSSVEVTLPNIQAPVPEVPPLRTMADSLTGFTLEKKIASLSSIRSRVQASDLNSYAAPVKGGSRPGSADSSLNSTNNLKRFIQERPLSYVIDLSDSDSSDSNNSEPDLSSSTKKDSTKKQKLDALQSEISKLNELIASKAKLKKAQSAETLNVLPVKHARQHSGPSALEKVQLSISRDTSMEPAPAFQSKSISPTKRQTSPLRRPHFPSKTSTPKSPERRSLSLQKPVFVPQATLRRSASPVKRAVALEPTKSTTETPSPQKMADNLLKSMSVTSSPVKVPSQPQWMSPPEDTSMTDVSAESRVTAEKDKDMTSVAQQASSNASPPVKNSTHQIEQQATVPTKRKFQKPSDLKHTPASLLDHKLKIATLETAINQITSSMDQGKTELDSVSEKLSALKASSLENHTIVQKLTKENLRLEQEIREREKQKQKNLELSKSAIATAETLKAEEKRLMNLLLTLKTNVESGKMSLDALRAECALLQSQTGSQGVESSFVPSPEPQKPKRVMVQSPAKAKTSAPAAVQSPPVKLDFLDHLLKLLADAQVKLSVADSLETPDPSSVFQEEPTVTPLIVLNDVLVSEQDLSWPSDHLHHIEDYMDARNANKKQAQTTEPNFTASVETTPKSPVKPSFKPYTSVLGGYRSLRQTETSDNGSLTYENNLDPTRNLCKFEMDGGECLDPGCAGQHFRDLNCSEEEMIKKMIERVYRLCSIEQLIDLTQQLEGSRDKLAKPKEIIQFIYSFERGNSLRSSPHSVFLETDKVSTKNDTPERPKVDLNPETAFKAPLSFPIKIEGLQKLVLGDDTSVTRYYDSPPTAETFEEMVKKTPTNTAAWLNYAIFMLPSDLSYETLEKKSTNVHKTLNILSRALRLNRFSYQLWYLYMEIYSRRGKEEDIRRLFKQALSFIPNDLELWWRFYTWETTFVAKREILDQMLIELTRNHLLTTMGGSRSLMILSVVVQYVKLSLDYEDSESAGTRFDCILSSKTADDIVSAVIPEAFRPINETFLFKNMSRKHVALAWLLRCHISYFGHLPHQAFLRSPYNYTIRDDLFLINWCAANVVLDVALFVGGTLTFIAGSFEGIADEPDTKHAYIAVARNLFTFQRDVMKKPNIVIRQSSAVAAAKYAEFPEMWLIDASFSDAEELNTLSKACVKLPSRSYIWHQMMKAQLLADKPDEAVISAVNGIRVYYSLQPLKEIPKGSQDVVHTALDMYKKALGLSTASMGLANLRVNASRRDLKNDIFLWFNMIHLVILSWDSLNMTLDKLLQLFQESFEYISHDKHRSLLWIKLLRILTHPLIKPSQDVKDLVSTLDKAFGDMQAYFTCPTYCRDCDHEFVKPVPSVDYYFIDKLLTFALTFLSRDQFQELLRLFMQTRKICIPLPFISEVVSRDQRMAMEILSYNLQLDPTNAHCWRIVFSLCKDINSRNRIKDVARKFLTERALQGST